MSTGAKAFVVTVGLALFLAGLFVKELMFVAIAWGLLFWIHHQRLMLKSLSQQKQVKHE